MSGVTDRYDQVMYTPQYRAFFEDSDFANFGYWEPGTKNAKEASENLMERLLAFLPEKKGTILDVACGKGATTRHLCRSYPPETVTAVNLSEKQLETARANAPGATFARMDAVDLRFPDSSFDAVVCVEAAFHFDTRERFLREALRILKPGGRVVLSDVLMTLDAERRREHRHEANYLADPSAYETLLRRVGFASFTVQDVTEESWRGFFRYITAFWHERFLREEIDRRTLERCLETNYARVGDLTYYLLVTAQKADKT
ncbi:MAG TPA: methyltransferase domain-containing protein [Verrucomicrobiae bacterium]|nr:methyltransferase domain-containing protein [Verrucomicrobiae bacterium]